MNQRLAILETLPLPELAGYARNSAAALEQLREIWKDSEPTAPVRVVMQDHLETIEIAFRRLDKAHAIKPMAGWEPEGGPAS